MLRRTSCRLSGEYTAVVIGGGLSGCHIAGKLAQGNVRTLLVEQGPDPRKTPWHTELPSSQFAHRLAHRYEKLEVTTPQQGLAPGEASKPVTFPRPQVLGGSGIMGGRSWILGSVEDWEGSGFSFKKDIHPFLLKLECMESTMEPHRGRRGAYFITPSLAMSPLYRPFLEACTEMKIPLTPNFNKPSFALTPSCGRPEVCIDKVTMKAEHTLSTALKTALTTLRPLHIATNTTAVSLLTDGQDKSKVTGVQVRLADGGLDVIKADYVVLCAGAVHTPQILSASKESLTLPPGVGEGYWDCPQVLLQFRCNTRDSLNCLRDPISQTLAYFGWKYLTHQSSMCSGFDDMVAFVSSKKYGRH